MEQRLYGLTVVCQYNAACSGHGAAQFIEVHALTSAAACWDDAACVGPGCRKERKNAEIALSAIGQGVLLFTVAKTYET